MIGKPEWFQRRKYGGWGLAPKTWQGWAYIGAAILLILGSQIIPGIGQTGRIVTLALIAIVMIADTIHMMAHIKKDERDTLHEAIAERNAMWAMVTILCAGIAYQVATSIVKDSKQIDPVIIIALITAVLVKAGTNIYLDRKN